MPEKTLLLVGVSDEAFEAKRVVLEGAGYSVHALDPGASARPTAERIGASLIVIDAAGGAAQVRAALEELSAPDAPSSIPVLVIGEAGALKEFEGPGRAVAKPAEKRSLLNSARGLIESRAKRWAKRRTT